MSDKLNPSVYYVRHPKKHNVMTKKASTPEPWVSWDDWIKKEDDRDRRFRVQQIKERLHLEELNKTPEQKEWDRKWRLRRDKLYGSGNKQ